MIIAIEGIDGAGKTTLARGLVDSIREAIASQTASPVPVIGVTEPYDQRFKQLISELWHELPRAGVAKQLALLYAADRLSKPLWGVDCIVVSDRSLISSFAYQRNRAADVSLNWLLRINRHCQAPDLVLYLDLDPTLAYGRIVARSVAQGRPVDPQERLASLTTVRRNYEDVLKKLADRRSITVRRLDASRDAETLLAAALKLVLPGVFASLK